MFRDMGGIAERTKLRQFGVAGAQPMLFAHGYGCDQAMWRLVVPEFARDYRIITFDHVGFGGSDLAAWSPDRYGTLDAYAADVLEIVRELDLHDVIFVGHSVAAMIGLLATVAEPDLFAHLILVGPSPRYIDDPATGYIGGFSRADIDELLEAVDTNYLGWSTGIAPLIMGNADRPELGAELVTSFCRTDPRVAKTFARATFLADNRSDLPKVSVPSLVLQCADDVIAPESVGRYVHQNIPDCQFVALRATGHCPNLSAPQETAGAIRDYLRSDAGRR